MKFSSKRAQSRGLSKVCAFSIIAVMASACTADPTTPPQDLVTPQPLAQVNVEVAARGLNLLQAPAPRTASLRQTRTTVGSGSYICSPAGFGQPSQCYVN